MAHPKPRPKPKVVDGDIHHIRNLLWKQLKAIGYIRDEEDDLWVLPNPDIIVYCCGLQKTISQNEILSLDIDTLCILTQKFNTYAILWGLGIQREVS